MTSPINNSATDDTALLQLRTFKEARDQEVAEYQINIDNFTRAIIKIDAEYASHFDVRVMKDACEFKEHLQKLLADNKKEQLKSIIMRDVLVDQIVELERP
jgi:hypothetical protein